jgi:DNA invertase Pin-like site-specific DNA recombinase
MTRAPHSPEGVGHDAQDSSAPLPRPARQCRRPKTERGLPPDLELQRLAAEYLRVQRKHWPALVKEGLLPEGEGALGGMVEDFKRRHRTGQVDPEPLRALLKHCPKLAGAYNRYSCDNSSPTSIVDQMVHVLDKARKEDRFVPWSYVFCDYSVTGLDGSRQGYSSYKKVLQDGGHFIDTTYVDDFTRPSRDEVEWWRLAHLSRRLQTRMVGASDGFDLSAPNWDMMISVYGLLSRLFIKGLREKVKRGMRGAARRGSCLGKLPLGFTRCARRDEQGGVVRDKDGLPQYVPCVDPATRRYRVLLYELFVEKCWSIYRITRHFNALRVDGWAGWTEAGIKKLLWSPSGVGVFVWNKTRREYDWEAERWVVLRNPRADWEVYHDPDLALVPMERWKAARRRLAAMRRRSPLTGRKMSRNQRSATTLFSGSLFCGYCGHELTLMRSAGRYKVMGCTNGPAGKHGCGLRTTKSTRIIERSLLGLLRDRVLTEEAVDSLVGRANALLAEEARRPRAGTGPLRAELRRREAAVAKLFLRVEAADDEELCRAYDRRIKEHQREVARLRGELRQAEEQNAAPPALLDRGRVRSLLADLRGLLSQEIPAAAEAIRAWSGRITIRQEEVPGRKTGAKWVASFSPDLLGWLRRAAQEKGCPDSVTLEYLGQRNWIKPEELEVPLELQPSYAQLARAAAELAARGASVETIARSEGTTWQTARAALDFARTGRCRQSGPRKGTPRKRGAPQRRAALGAEVARLRDRDQLAFARIAAMLGVSEATATRAYDRAHPEAVREAAREGRTPKRGRYSHLGPHTFERIRAALAAGGRPRDVAAGAGCGLSTVYRVRSAMRRKGGAPPPLR